MKRNSSETTSDEESKQLKHYKTAISNSTQSFEIPDIPKLQVNGVEFKRPEEIAYFSLDEQRRLHVMDKRSLCRYKEPDIQRYPNVADLSVGFADKYIERDETIPEHLDTLIETLLEKFERISDISSSSSSSSSNTSPLVVTWRGIVTRLMAMPYAKEEWTFHACRHDDTIFIEEPPKQKRKMDERGRLMCYWGYRFEAVATVPVDEEETGGDRDFSVNTNVQFCTVVKTKLANKHAIVMGAEVDCISSAGGGYVELKTSKLIQSDRDRFTFERHKLLKFYLQSFLVGIEKIIVGFRNNNGILQHFKSFDTLKLPRLVREQKYWDPNSCLKCCDLFLDWLKSIMTANDHRIIYIIKYRPPFKRVELEIVNGREDLQFLPGRLFQQPNLQTNEN